MHIYFFFIFIILSKLKYLRISAFLRAAMLQPDSYAKDPSDEQCCLSCI